MCNPTFSATTNRITSSGYTFDNAGNTTADPLGRTFVYDAENKQTSVSNSGGMLGTYYYDGDGKRVKKDASTGDDIIFIYDAAGKLIEERNLSGTLQTSYVYAGGRLLSTETSSGTTYLTSDHLGSPRINTDGSGNVTARHDYHPFGEEIYTSQRTTGVGYATDGVRKQFTGYERDGETGLDFAQARTYHSASGRFSSPDPIYFSKDHQANPQRWNSYLYVINAPLTSTDPKGLKPKRIDIFITISVEERNASNAKRDWYELAKKAPKGTVVRVFTVDDKSATVERFKASLKTEGTTVIVYGHSTATQEDLKNAERGAGPLKGTGLHFSNGDFTNGSDSNSNDIMGKVSASAVLLFTCASGSTPESIRDRMNGGGMLVMHGGADGETTARGNEEAAYAATDTLIGGGTLEQAQAAAQTAINSSTNDDSTVLYFANVTAAAGFSRRKQ